MFKKYQHIHFVGIGGIGMSGIAEVLLNLGYAVSGSDAKASAVTTRLKRLGAKVTYGHRASSVQGAHVVVVSSAIAAKNPEVVEARRQSIPVAPRAEMLAELARLKYSIAIAGTHGKTTTTTLVSTVLAAGGLDPTIVIGGRVNAWRTNARLGKGDYLVAEADESDRSFLKLDPTIAVITNIDEEHMESYRDFADMQSAFRMFADKVPFYGVVVCCEDHPEVVALRKQCTRPVTTYGFAPTADFSATHVRQVEEQLQFVALYRGTVLGDVTMRGPGQHNVSNALAAIAVGHFLDIPFKTIAKGLGKYRGIERRFQMLKRTPQLVVNDYAHHPVEIRATIQAVRDGWPDRRIIVVHQPHRYSRLQQLFPEFVQVLSEADGVVLMKLYAASEAPIPGVSARKLADALREAAPALPVQYAEAPEAICQQVRSMSDKGDVILFLGAGDIWKVGQMYAGEK